MKVSMKRAVLFVIVLAALACLCPAVDSYLNASVANADEYPFYTDLEYFNYFRLYQDAITREWFIVIKERGTSKDREIRFRGSRLTEDEYKKTQENVLKQGWEKGTWTTYYVTEYIRYYATRQIGSASPRGNVSGKAKCRYTNKEFTFSMGI